MTKEELIKNLKYIMKKHEHDRVDTFGTNISLMCKDVLDYLEQESKWIPVSERLPKNDEDVLVCYQQGGMEVVYYHKDDTYYPTQYANLNETGWYNENGDALYFEPIAWMPLPEPYKAESEEI